MSTERSVTTLNLTDWGVGRCACGRVVLQLDGMQKSFAPAEFAEFYRLVQAAMHEFGIPPSPRSSHVSARSAH